MPINRHKLLRLQTLITMMRKEEYPNFTSFLRQMRSQDIAGVYHLSSRTFNRDIELLRKFYGAPLHYDESRRGFYLRDREWYHESLMLAPFEDTPSALSPLLSEHVMPEALTRQLPDALQKLNFCAESDLNREFSPEQLETLNTAGYYALPQIMQKLFLSQKQRSLLQITHRSSEQTVANCQFAPQIIAWLGGLWFTKGFAFQIDGRNLAVPKIVVLAVHRIESALLLDRAYVVTQQLRQQFDQERLFHFHRLPEVQIQYDSQLASYVKERYPASDSVHWRAKPDGSILLTLRNVSKFEALNLVLGAQGHAVLLAPEELKNTVCHAARKILAAHAAGPEATGD